MNELLDGAMRVAEIDRRYAERQGWSRIPDNAVLAAHIERLTENRNAWIAGAMRLEAEIERLRNLIGHAAALIATQHVHEAADVLRVADEDAT